EVSTLQQEIAALEAAASAEQTKRNPDTALVLANKTQVAEKQARIDQIQPLLNLYQQIYSNLVVLGKPVESDSTADSRMTRLQATLDLYQNLYINLLSSLETVRLARLQNTPNIVQIEPAAVPKAPIRPQPLQNTALAAAVGLLLAGGIVFLIEYLDDTLKSPEDMERALGVPALGFVAEIKYKGDSPEEVYVSRQPRSPVAEAFRTLRTNIEFASAAKPIRTILVTSPGPEEGKTTVAVNLAAIIATSGKTVALVDADMRRPRVHRLLGVPNRGGLSRLFRDHEEVYTVTRTPLDLPNLKVITSGTLPPNPAELLGAPRMREILAELSTFADVVVIDTPPSLVADAQILAGKVDAVLFVVMPGKTRAATAAAALELFKRAGARVIGTVLNRIPRRRDYYYGNYSYYSPSRYKSYYSEPVTEPARSHAEQVETKPPAPEPSLTYSFLQKVAGLSQRIEELPPPDPGKK
ncbi:MAG: polysaccharide biosynthesis tyrosine autokinase, partial [Bacteroidota bacterium]